MEAEEKVVLIQAIADKDRLIAELQRQIELQSFQIDNLNKNVSVLSHNIAALTASISNQAASAVPAANSVIGKRRSATNSIFGEKKLSKVSRTDSILSTENASDENNATLDSDASMSNPILISSDECAESGAQQSYVNTDSQSNTWADVVSKKVNIATKNTPIQLGINIDGDYNMILSNLRNKFGTSGYEWLQLRRGAAPRIICHGTELKNSIMEFLSECGVEFNTFAEKGCKKKAFIIRGLIHGSCDDNIKRIANALAEYHIEGVVNISKFETPTMKRSKNSTPLYQLVLESNVDVTRLVDIKIIDSFCVRFESMHNSKVVQCRRCQRFSHTAASCAFKYRCVQCLLDHDPGSCPRITNKKIPIGCINCQAAGFKHIAHTANDLVHCEYFKSIKDRRGVAAVNAGSKSNSIKKQNKPVFVSTSSDSLRTSTSSGFQKQNFLEDIRTPANNPYLSSNKSKIVTASHKSSNKLGKSNGNFSDTCIDSSKNGKLRKVFERLCGLIEELL